MFGKRAVKLVMDLDLLDDLRPYDEAGVREVLEEMEKLYYDNTNNSAAIRDGNLSLLPTVRFRHQTLHRNKRCVLAYIYHRMRKIRQIRWQLSGFFPPEIKSNLVKEEKDWLASYNKSLTTYMKSISDEYEINLTLNFMPPKSFYIEVKCLTDYGRFEVEDGDHVMLKANTFHLLPRSRCEPLIRQGVLEHCHEF